MANKFTDKIFSDTYKDDYKDSDNYYRVLFNSGRALQARELTQMQTIIQKEMERFGRNIFKEGSSVNPGGPTLNTRYEFIKLDTSTNTLPTDLSTITNDEFIGQTSAFKVVVLEGIPATASDPATLYIRYTDTLSATSDFSTSQRVTAGENIVGTVSGVTLTVQTTDTTANPATGFGSRISIDRGDFFTQGHFVFAEKQSKIISKYTSLPTATVGFKVQQDIVSSTDAEALYDNQGATPNTSAPGADRYRIRLVLATQDEIDSDENFVYFCRVINGNIFDVVSGHNQFKAIEDRMAQRTNDINGDFIINPFLLQHEADSNANFLRAVVSPGLAYVNGYRAEKTYTTRLRVPKAQKQQHQQHPQQQQWNNGSYGGGYGNGGGDGQSGGYGGGQQGNYGVHQPYSGHGMQQPSNPILGQQSSGGLGHLNGYGGSQSQQPGGGHGLGLNGFGGGQLPGMGGFDGQQQSQHQQAHVPQPPQHAPQPPQHPPQQQQMGGMGGYANGLSSRLGGGGLGGGGMSVLRASDDASLPAGLAAASSQFGMSANAPSFTPGGSGGGGCGCGGLGGSLGGGGGGSASFEQESLRAAAENLWAGTSAAAPSSRSFPGSSFTVPDLNKVPSLNAIEAESMRAAAAGLWDQGSGGSAAAPSADSLLGMPPLPSGMLGGCGAAASDEIGLCGADLLAGLRLDGGSEPSMR